MAHRFIFVQRINQVGAEPVGIAIGHIETVSQSSTGLNALVMMVSGQRVLVQATVNELLGLIHDATREHSR